MRRKVSEVLESLDYRIERKSGGRVSFKYCEELPNGMRQWNTANVPDTPTIIVDDDERTTVEGDTKGSTIGMSWVLTPSEMMWGANMLEEAKKKCLIGVLVRMLVDGYTALEPIKCYIKKGLGSYDNTVVHVGVKAMLNQKEML